MPQDLTLVLDIGKSHAKLLLIDAGGAVRARRQCANAGITGDGPGRPAMLGVAALEDWLCAEVPALPERARIGRIVTTTHGAAFCALDGHGLVRPPTDYEWDGYAATRPGYLEAVGAFAEHGTPPLPAGLNAGLQLHHLREAWPADWARVTTLLPYPQYWSWWWSGVAASEVSSLGCHTHLWRPAAGDWSAWARRSGIAARFAPRRGASELLGAVRPGRAARLGLPADAQVVCGVHDSNACLARYLRDDPEVTLVSTGTWVVVMAPGAAIDRLDPARDELVNVAVDGRPVPTARFMGGREFALLCGEADPAGADAGALARLLAAELIALPEFAGSGGPYPGRRGGVRRAGAEIAPGAVDASLRPALASLYCALMTAQAVRRLRAAGPLVLEGPLAGNAAYRAALAALLPQHRVHRSIDPVEGTARGAWMLARWDAPGLPAPASAAEPAPDPALAAALRAHEQRWTEALAA